MTSRSSWPCLGRSRISAWMVSEVVASVEGRSPGEAFARVVRAVVDLVQHAVDERHRIRCAPPQATLEVRYPHHAFAYQGDELCQRERPGAGFGEQIGVWVRGRGHVLPFVRCSPNSVTPHLLGFGLPD